jgi:signal peptidase II
LAVTGVVAAAVAAADQVTKSQAEAHLHRPTHVWGPFGLAIGSNTGSAFSFFTGRPLLLAAVAAVVVGLLVVLAWRTRRTVTSVALGLMLGGALGNLSDRAFRGRHGAVVDFVTLTHWPTFNVADACIVVGTVLFVLSELVRRPAPGTPVAPGEAGHAG